MMGKILQFTMKPPSKLGFEKVKTRKKSTQSRQGQLSLFNAGGQLFKQIHKFFGSERHMAGVRGFAIGLLQPVGQPCQLLQRLSMDVLELGVNQRRNLSIVMFR